MIFPPLFWIALRLGSRFMTLALFGTSVLALLGTAFGYANGATSLPTGELLFLTQIFLIVIAVIFLLVTAVEEERRTATAGLQAHIDQLQEALTKIRLEDDAKTQFVATLAHELRNPLAPLLSTIELLTLRGPDAKDFPVMLNTMRDRVRTMARLLDDLLDISRITHQKLRLQKTTLDIVQVVRSSVESMSGYMQKRNLAFNVTLPHSETLLLEADPIRVEQIIVNLLHNAAKYTEVGGSVNLSVARDKDKALICVKDSGIGIPKHMLQRVFEPFLQVNAKSGGSGLGIGLSLTKRLVELHGGTIEARSEGEGHGSEFIVRLPLLTVSPIQPTLPKEHTPTRVERTPSGTRILLVDDNHAASETLGKLLEFKGYSVRFTHDGTSTLRAAEEFEPHIIMLDIGLPDMSGYDVARTLRERGTDAAMIAVTGYGQSEDKARSKEAGFDHHLTKPVGINDLEKILAPLSSRA
jgi:signal transduction histidine kinase/CheY-like chemotaxis protein